MNILLRITALAFLATSLSFAAQAHDHSKMGHDGSAAMWESVMEPIEVGDLTLSNAFTRATLPGAKVGGGYLKITNSASEPDRLIGGSTPAAERVEVHEMKMNGDIMQMRQLKEGLEIPAGETVELSPGGLHLMLMNIVKPLKEGDMIPVTLEFTKTGKIEVQFMVGAANAASMEHN
ncbi:copper chaperone PCu(A)C [Phyllobacterium sp. K27]